MDRASQTKTDTIKIQWTIPHFMNLLENKQREIRKKRDKRTRLRLKMRFSGLDYIIKIYFLSPDPVLKSKLAIGTMNNQRRPNFTKEYHPVQANKWQNLASFHKSYITSICICNLTMATLLSEGNLNLEFEFVVSKNKVEHSDVPESQLSNDFGYLLNNGLFFDVIIKSMEGNEYKVHKAVLASRSPVLKAHFEHNTIECQTNVVESPLEAEVLSEVLTFIYTEKAPSVDVIPEKLLAAADYYQLSRLKSLCEVALHEKLTVENAIETLQLADLHTAKKLKQLTLEFIKDGQAKLITETEGWAMVKSVDLIKTIYEYIMKDNNEVENSNSLAKFLS